jgi:uncharacterized protein YndB with AHSA1/START domain
VPRYAAKRVLLAPLDDVWAFLAEPYHLSDWWPGVSGVEPDRRGLAPGARWKVIGPDRPSLFRRPQAPGMLLVLDVVPGRRIAFQLTGGRIDAEIELAPVEANATEITLAVETLPLGGIGRSFPTKALANLYSLVQTGAES